MAFDPAIDAIHAALDHLEVTSPTPIKYGASESVPDQAAAVVEPAPAEQVVEDYKAQITAIYEQHAPERVGDVDAMLQKYQGREEKLLGKVARRYCPSAEEKAQQEVKQAAYIAKKQAELDRLALNHACN